jgi:hypothetical protein
VRRLSSPILTLSWLAAALPAQPGWIQAKLFDNSTVVSAYDSARGRVVQFGADPGSAAATREWDGNAWITHVPVHSPTQRSAHCMCYDAGSRRVVLFGGVATGSNGVSYPSDLWEWDGQDWTMRKSATSPPGRSGAAMAYDAVRGRVVLFGGFYTTVGPIFVANLDDTWEWDGTGWLQMTPAAKPQARLDHGMAFDDVRGRVVMFGGAISNPAGYFPMYSDVWEWDGNIWSQASPSVSPSARSRHGMVFDSARRRTVVFGGFAGGPGLSETWEWDGASWTMRSPAASPSARAFPALSYDSARARTVLFGGVSGARPLLDLWEYDGNGWILRDTATASPDRRSHALAYDPARQQTLLFGGWTSDTAYSADTWRWDGFTWQRLAPSASPSSRISHALVSEGRSGRMLLFGGDAGLNDLADTWAWDGTSWTLLNPGTAPSARGQHAMATDLARGRVVLFGGLDGTGQSSETWEWDGNVWQLRTPSKAPQARHAHAMAYDWLRAKVVLFGGRGPGAISVFGDTWEWDGTVWTQLSPMVAPAARSGHAMAFDVLRGRTVLFGGLTYAGMASDTWEWDGTAWSPVAVQAAPPPRYAHAMAYDLVHGQVVMTGGFAHVALPNTWLYGDAARIVPAAVTTFGSGCAGGSGIPTLASSTPLLGTRSCALELSGCPPNGPVAIGLAGAQQTLPLGGGCTLYLGGPILALPALGNASGFATAALPVPADFALRAALVFAQGFVPAHGGLAVSPGVRLTLGY